MNIRHINTLKSSSLKVTPRRLALMHLLAEASVYLGPQQIWEKMRKRFKKLGLPTVYRNLEELVDAGVISRIIHPNRQLYYYLCENPAHHHHFICLACGKVEDIDFCAKSRLEKEILRKHKGKVLSHVLQVNGLCHNCAGIKEAQPS